MHHDSITKIAYESEYLESDNIAISSANSITLIPNTYLSSFTRLLITKLKKNGEVLFPYGQPLFKFIVLLPSSIFIEAEESIHLAIKSSLVWSLRVLSNFSIKIE